MSDETDELPSAFPDMRARRTAARLLSELLVTPDDGLAKFRKRRLGPDSTLDVAYLRQARGILEALMAALRASGEEPWQLRRELSTQEAGHGGDQGADAGGLLLGPLPRSDPPDDLVVGRAVQARAPVIDNDAQHSGSRHAATDEQTGFVSRALMAVP
ncbi:MAG: hypothetical protein HY744_29200, partial [Deltaproteobacteria bacterium]|nr:hypothetical protein [Deltaproteobacteria bacterium]